MRKIFLAGKSQSEDKADTMAEDKESGREMSEGEVEEMIKEMEMKDMGEGMDMEDVVSDTGPVMNNEKGERRK